MANPIHQDPARPAGAIGESEHRLDEVHVHHRERQRVKLWPWLLAFGLGLLALWALLGRSETNQVVSACDASTVHFAAGSASLTSGDKSELARLATCLKGNAARKVRLEGRASDVEGRTLARSRADALARELRGMGVSSAQFSVGVGTAVCTEATEACAQRNRSASAIPLRRQ
jgi:outer membrane protein OmpA-like peptidoglycan-associated protein